MYAQQENETMRFLNKLTSLLGGFSKGKGFNLDPRLNTPHLIAMRRTAKVSSQYRQRRASKAWVKRLLNVWHNTLVLMRPSRSMFVFFSCVFFLLFGIGFALYQAMASYPPAIELSSTAPQGEPLILKFSTELSTYKPTKQ